MSAKPIETTSRPAWRHPEREHIEKRLATIETESESLRSRRDACAEQGAHLGDRLAEVTRIEPKEYAEIVRLQREQFDVQQEQAKFNNRLGMLDIEKGGLMQRLRGIEEIEARGARGRGLAR